MKAALVNAYGNADVVNMGETPHPQIHADEILVRVFASSVSAGDWRIRSLEVPRGYGLLMRLFFGWKRPRKPILGTELCGEVIDVGENITRFKPGQTLIAMTGMQLGAHAEYVALKENAVIIEKPSELTVEEAAAFCFGGTAALDFLLNKAQLKAGERVLINGASGAVGSAAVQIAKAHGAEVTAVCSSAKAPLARQLGADHVIDYHRETLETSAQSWDVIMDNVGNLPWVRALPLLNEQGRLLQVVASLKDNLLAATRGCRRSQKAIAGTAREAQEDLNRLSQLAENGDYRPVIDRVYAFSDIRSAHEHVGKGHKTGNVVVKMV